ncbi:type II secretion system protein GspL [Pseudomonas sp. NFXW11]|uniref:type II secretion system protein GspL n=1 Tax=Pseudomonas sp. NFXW11 TaxID=2819531 RepID=UPI003CE9FF65
MNRLRIALPPLEPLLAASNPLAWEVEFAWLARSGQVLEQGRAPLHQLAKGSKPTPLECFLHPQDSLLTRIDLPQLPAARIKAAVACAAQALILAPIEQMHVAHGPRDAQGQVPLGWLPRAQLKALGRLLQQARLKLEGLYPAPFALAIPGPGQQYLCRVDEQLLLRQSATQGSVQPWLEDSLEPLRATGDELCWIGQEPPLAELAQLPASQRWSGAAPGWGLHGGAQLETGAPQGWGRALGCCALALAVWIIGLNLYAAREAEQGQRLKTQMSQRVLQVFPELPVVLNPLQQARQQLEARRNGSGEPGQGFASLLQQAGSAMPFIAGSVQSLNFADQRLQLELLADTAKVADSAWQGALVQAGYSVQVQGNGWVLAPTGDQPAVSLDSPGGDEDE